MMASTFPLTQLSINLPFQHNKHEDTHMEVIRFIATKPRRRRRKPAVYCSTNHYHYHFNVFKPKSFSNPKVHTRVSAVGGGGGTIDANPQQSTPSDIGEKNHTSSTFGDSYVALFVRMLGLDHDPLDREQAIVALWKYSLGGKKCIDTIMQFHGCINLVVNLLTSESSSTSEAAAGLLRSVASVNLYRELVAECGAIEEICGLLCRPSLTAEVKEQSICTLWNLSVDENLRVKIANTDVLLLLIKSLDDEDVKVKEAAGGVLANLSLSHSNHNIMVEAGVIPKLAKLLKTAGEESKVIRKEARNALLELVKDEYYRILVIEEGVVPVPIIGTAAYKSFRPGLYSWPSLPDGTDIEQSSKGPSRFGASELLLGLNIDNRNVDIEEAKMSAILGRTRQQFLARIGAIELEDEKKSQSYFSKYQRLNLLPWMDGVARLVLILGLEDEVAIARAAESIANASINEHMRISFKEAGAIKHLVQLLGHNNDAVRLAVTCALERLSVSHSVRQIIEAEGVVSPLVNILKNSENAEILMEKTLGILAWILDPTKEMKAKFYYGPVNGSKKELDAASGLDASIEFTGRMAEMPRPKTNTRKEMLDSAVISRLVEILKTSSPNLQRKAASILEFVTVIDPSMDSITAMDIEAGLHAVFQHKVLEGSQWPEKYALEVEEAGLAISAASRLLTRLLDSQRFCQTINSTHFTKLLREILKSAIPLHNKDWVAACLVKLSSLSGPNLDLENPINMEVTLYETIPRLIVQMKSSLSPETREAAVVELNSIISEGVADSTRAIASEGGIYSLVKLIEEGSDRAVEAGLAILYSLSMDSENHSAIMAAGAVPVLRRIVLSQRPPWTRALRLLRNLPT
ncbi:Arm domain-containing protein/KAP domain-containing protein [Cephalotus follicularis]|uniref:Arm domain-containing protein/KAP domain-containing protein n=1 Tax=Cephalotus follicularis TaxID=3775 RepID=A0A1Q3B6A8_CEPFO|nr:Arm domain-containing protein/KAP domain-containing protein [Cephalotus follicularis]